MWITEFGYAIFAHNLPFSTSSISELAPAKYLIRSLLDAFVSGVEKVYIYALLDDLGSHPNFHGLLDRRLVPRPAFGAVENLIALFKDTVGALLPER